MCLLLFTLLFFAGLNGSTLNASDDVADQTLTAHAKLELAQIFYKTQLLGPLDHPVGNAISIGGLTIPARGGPRNALELDLKGKGTYTAFTRDSPVAITVPGADTKHPLKITLYLKRDAAHVWTYRNATQLTVTLGAETMVLIDVNGDGTYNQPGVDGMAWSGNEWLFPLPGPDERWCSRALNITGLSLGPLGQDITMKGQPLTTTLPECLPVLQGINLERVQIGLTPRPEDAKLSRDIQLHCHYMALNHKLEHEEVAGQPGYTVAGSQAGPRSILGQGSAPPYLAATMTGTAFHRQDVLRPDTMAFGVGFDGAFGGIDGRSRLRPIPASWWPVLYPAPDEDNIRLRYIKPESPDACPGNNEAGFPITVYFGTDDLKLTKYTLMALSGNTQKQEIDCYSLDPKSFSMTSYQRCVCIIPKQLLEDGLMYEVSMAVTVAGSPWTRTWRFSTGNRSRK